MIFIILLLSALTMIAFEFESLLTFFIYLHYAQNLYTNAEEICLKEVGCFANAFPWATFPTEHWPIVRMRSMPLEPSQIDAKLLRWHNNTWIPIQNKTDFNNWYDVRKVIDKHLHLHM